MQRDAEGISGAVEVRGQGGVFLLKGIMGGEAGEGGIVGATLGVAVARPGKAREAVVIYPRTH